MALLPGPQSVRGTRPIDTAPTVALPINVSTTRRERFMVEVLLPRRASFHWRYALKQAKAHRFTATCDAEYSSHPPPEKCEVKVCANEPKPPRVTPLEPESDDVADTEW